MRCPTKYLRGRISNYNNWLKSVQRFQRRRFKCEKLTDGRTNAYPWQKLTWPMARWAKNQGDDILWLLQEGYIRYLGGMLTAKQCYVKHVTLLPKLWWTETAWWMQGTLSSPWFLAHLGKRQNSIGEFLCTIHFWTIWLRTWITSP
jgi:hypothetical protein